MILRGRLRLRPGARAARRLSAGRGHASPALQAARRAAHPRMRASTASLFARLGAATPRASRWSATSTSGTAGAARCASASTAASGRFSSPTSARARSTNTRSSRADGALHAAEGRSVRLRGRAAALHRLGRRRHRATSSGPTPTISNGAQQGEPRRKPMSIYEVHLGSWRRGEDGRFLTYDELADTLDPLCRRSRLHPSRTAAGHRASARRLLGLSADRPVRADAPVRRSRRLRPLRRPRPRGRARRDPRLGARAFPDRRARPRPFRRRAALRARRSAPRLPSRLEHRDLRFRPARGRQFPATPARSTGSTASTSTACASMRSPRCSISTIRAKPGEWLPNADGGNENRDAVAFLQARQRTGLRRLSRRGHDRRGIDRLGRRLAPDQRRRPRLRLQMEHGLDARHARIYGARSGPSALEPRQADLRPALRLHREFRAADLARRGRARQRLADRQDARRRMAALRQRRAPITASCGAIPARSCCSWARSSARPANGTSTTACPGGCSITGRIRACRRWCATSTASIARRRRCMRAIASPRASAGSSSTTTTQSVFAFLRIGARGRPAGRGRLQFHAGAAPRLSHRPAATPGAGARRSTPTPTIYGGSNVGNLGGVHRRAARRCTACRLRPR